MTDPTHIFRDKPVSHYSIPKEPIEDDKLSIEAKGALSILHLAQLTSEIISMSYFQKKAGIGRDKARRIIKELEEAGYVKREQRRHDESGTFMWAWVIYDSPQTDSPPTVFQGMDAVEDLNRSSTSHNSDQITKEKGKEENIVTNSLFPDLLDQEDQIVNNITNTSITPPYSPPPQDSVPIEQKSKPKKSKRSEFCSVMEDVFCEETGIKHPLAITAKQKRAAGELWWNPLWEIYYLFRPDEERQGEVKLVYDEQSLNQAVDLIKDACQQMKDNDLTISFPKSIVAIATARYAEGHFTPANGNVEYDVWAEYKEAVGWDD